MSRRRMRSTRTGHGSMDASSSSMTGISSLIGYTRLHWLHLSAVPFFTGSTFVLQFGQARISSSSGSTGMESFMRGQGPRWWPETAAVIIIMKMRRTALAILVIVLTCPALGRAQSSGGVAPDPASYFFLLGRYYE